MLDIKTLRKDPQTVSAQLARRGFTLDLERFASLDAERKQLQTQTERLQSERNAKAKAIGKAKASGEDISPLVAEVGDLGDRLDQAKETFVTVQQQLDDFLRAIPNVPDAAVPQGDSEDDNMELHRWGEPPEFNFAARDHVDLGSDGSLDFEAAAKISGSRFVVIRGQLARMQRALTQFMLDVHTLEHGYEEVYVPYIVNQASLYGTGQLPKFANDQFALSGDAGFYLIPTAEVPVTNLFRGEIIDADQLPVRHVCHTPCFRSEAGSHGRDTRGMIRQHQFEKVELVQLVSSRDVLAGVG